MNCIEWLKSEMRDTWISKNNRLRIYKNPLTGLFDVHDVRFQSPTTVAANCVDLGQAKKIASEYWLEQA